MCDQKSSQVYSRVGSNQALKRNQQVVVCMIATQQLDPSCHCRVQSTAAARHCGRIINSLSIYSVGCKLIRWKKIALEFETKPLSVLCLRHSIDSRPVASCEIRVLAYPQQVEKASAFVSFDRVAIYAITTLSRLKPKQDLRVLDRTRRKATGNLK